MRRPVPSQSKRRAEVLPEWPRGDDFAVVAAREDAGLVGLDAEVMHRYPHEFSGGQRQRIAIARAIILKPEFKICT